MNRAPSKSPAGLMETRTKGFLRHLGISPSVIVKIDILGVLPNLFG